MRKEGNGLITISLCMIVKNEEETLGKCLQSVKDIVDEIIIVDTGSTDRTKEVAKGFTDNIYDFEWIDDFSAARNFAYSKSQMEYIMWLDADDVILPDDREKFLKLKESLSPDVQVVMMKYNTGFDEKGNVNFSYYRERLSRRDAGFLWQEPVHEYLAFNGKSVNVDIAVTHNKKHWGLSDRNLRIYERQLKEKGALSPRGMYYYARELKDNGRFEDAANMFLKFLDSGRGWLEDNIGACLERSRCLLILGRREEAFHSLTRSFVYGIPRAEIVCQMGYHFKDYGLLKEAVYWFETALNLKKPTDSWGFFQDDFWGFIPALELAVCYDALGDTVQANQYNEIAGSFKPDSKAVAHNRKYFSEKLSQNNP